MERAGQIPSVVYGIRLSKTTQNAILNNLKLKPNKAIIDEEDIVISGVFKKKYSAQSIIENVQNHHSHKSDGYELKDIVRINKISKQFLNKTSKVKRKQFCE